MASLRLLPLASAFRSASTSFFRVAASSGWRKISPAAGASRSSPRCGRRTALEYGHSLILSLCRSMLLESSAFHGIAVLRHLDRRREDLGQAELPELGEHGQEPARIAGGDGGQRTVLRRIGVSLPLVEFRGRAGRRDAEGVDPDDLARLRIDR